MKTSEPQIRLISKAPSTGVYRLELDGALTYLRNTLDWHYLRDDVEAFFLRVYGPGDHQFKGADLGILVTKSRMQTEDNQLTERCRAFIDGIHARYVAADVEAAPLKPNFLAYLK